MNRRRSLLIGLVSAIMAAMLVYGVYVLQVNQIEMQQTVQVAVPKDFIRAGVLIQEDMVELKPVQKGSYKSSMMSDLNEIVGLETLIPLGKEEPILQWKVNRYHLLPNEWQATFQIPKEYLLSVSNGIRAGDRVRVYVSGTDDGSSRRLFGEKEIKVASVKSSTNVEVDNPKNPNLLSKVEGDKEKMYASRLEANGAIDQINLNLTENEWLEIDRLCSAKKAKLVVAFSSSSILRED
ncbi:SAF domain-containing protein [Paenibacillus aceris]|uniref:Flp pilus assembly protein CpaB n=1 Tax=Paenibacillus aceris TaxID=869555 RepID=A0ABS4I8S1_9BACL|nr:SAF domain-containing protein [Paenibacillus aceris]MBP1966866.1 Flp pilus assembly protein CpaB [Paenibacillus aceris]NHW38937.1 flagellar biosynthesis protein FlgA [Paenibacillus aceris]